MKRKWIAILMVFGILVSAMPAAFAADASRSYDFDLSAAGEHELHVTPGQTITLTLALSRTDSAEAAEMYAMQTELLYDDSFFTLVEQSIMTEPDVNRKDLARRTGGRALYLNYLSLNGGTLWEPEVVVGSFQLKVIAERGASTVHPENCIVSTEDGKDSFAVTSEAVTVIVSTDCTVTFEKNDGSDAENSGENSGGDAQYDETVTKSDTENGGSDVQHDEAVTNTDAENGGNDAEDRIVQYGERVTEPDAPVRAGYAFDGWYRDLDCTEQWDFAEDTVTGNMTLYAGWTAADSEEAAAPLQAQSAEGGFPTLLILGIVLLLILVFVSFMLFGKKRVAFDTDGGTVQGVIFVKKGALLARPATPVKAGAMFAGWYRDAEKTIPWDFENDCVEKSMTLYALWK